MIGWWNGGMGNRGLHRSHPDTIKIETNQQTGKQTHKQTYKQMEKQSETKTSENNEVDKVSWKTESNGSRKTKREPN